MKQLKTFEEMVEQERIEFLSKFKEWGDKSFPELCKYAGAWESCQIKSFEDGLQLLSAFSICREFVNESLMFRDYQRRIERVQYFINLLRKRTGMDKILTIPSANKEEHITLADKKGDGKPEDLSKKINEYIPEAPKHISEYIHLLSPDLQMLCNDIQSLRAKYAKHAEMAKELSDKGADEKIIAEHANIAVSTQREIDNIYKAVDIELSQKKESQNANVPETENANVPETENANAPEIGNANAPEAENPSALENATETTETTENANESGEETVNAETSDEEKSEELKAGEESDVESINSESEETHEPKKAKSVKMTKEVIDAMPEGEEKFKAKEARIRSNKTYLNRSDVKETPERIKEVELRKKELEEWGISFDK